MDLFIIGVIIVLDVTNLYVWNAVQDYSVIILQRFLSKIILSSILASEATCFICSTVCSCRTTEPLIHHGDGALFGIHLTSRQGV